MVDKRFTLSQCTLVFRSRFSMARIRAVSTTPAIGFCFRIFLSHWTSLVLRRMGGFKFEAQHQRFRLLLEHHQRLN